MRIKGHFGAIFGDMNKSNDDSGSAEMEPMEVMIDDLARQVAEKAIESASWRARAVIAETALEELRDKEAPKEDG